MTMLDVKTVAKALESVDKERLRMYLNNKTLAIYRLATLKNKARKNPPSRGICKEIENIHMVMCLSPYWKHFSGNRLYPVPGKTKTDCPVAAYYKVPELSEKWEGQQKRYRFSLIDHLLKNAPIFYKAIEERLK